MKETQIDKDFAVTIEHLEKRAGRKDVQFYHKRFIDYLKNNILLYSKNILDIGERNPLTIRIENKFNVKIDSTNGDLDTEFFTIPKDKYDIIICSHVIEHIFNPLWLLERIKSVMKDHSVIILGTPIKPCWITTSTGHFHEFDIYRFKKLMKRAGLKIFNFKHYYIYNRINWRMFTGIRPFLSSFKKRHGICILKKI